MRRVPLSWRKRRVVKWHDSYCVVASWSLEEQGRVPILARAAGLGFAVHKGRLAGDISELSSERAESLSSSEREDWMEAEPATRRPSAARFSPSCPNRSIFSRPSERKQDCLFARLVCPHLMPLPLKFPSQRLILDAPANRTILALALVLSSSVFPALPPSPHHPSLLVNLSSPSLTFPLPIPSLSAEDVLPIHPPSLFDFCFERSRRAELHLAFARWTNDLGKFVGFVRYRAGA